MSLRVHFTAPDGTDLGTVPARRTRGVVELKDGPYALIEYVGPDNDAAFRMVDKLLDRLKQPGDEVEIKGFKARLLDGKH